MPGTVASMTIKAYATTIEKYYEEEAKFINDPSEETLHEYHTALQRLSALRNELYHSNLIGDALVAGGADLSRLDPTIEIASLIKTLIARDRETRE